MGADSYTYRKWSNVYEYYFKDACGDVVYAMNQIVEPAEKGNKRKQDNGIFL